MGNQRVVGIVGVVVVAVVAIVVAVSSGGDDDGSKSQTTETATTAQSATETATTETQPVETEVPEVKIEGGKPVGGVKRIEVKKGDTILFKVSSSDTSGEIHFHGYDIMRDVAPGKPVTFKAEADAEGIFEVEIEDTKTQVAQVRVEP